jgi:hypothetical protein
MHGMNNVMNKSDVIYTAEEAWNVAERIQSTRHVVRLKFRLYFSRRPCTPVH